jgi:site-specific DNA recombinase
VIGGIPFTQGPIAHILKNRTYVGELNHRENAYPADHAPIVSRELFDAVQKQLEAKRNAKAEKHQASGALLIGRLFDQYGRPMTPTYACKGARRYPYYVSRPSSMDYTEAKQPIVRVRADEIERQIITLLGAHPTLSLLSEAIVEQSALIASESANGSNPGTATRRLINCVVERVRLGDARIKIALTNEAAQNIGRESISIHWRQTSSRVCHELLGTSTADNDDSATRLDVKTRASLVRTIARSRVWLKAILLEGMDVGAIAAREARTVRSVQLLLPLAFLAPIIVTAAAEGKLPPGLGQRLLSEVPTLWEDQRNYLAASRGHPLAPCSDNPSALRQLRTLGDCPRADLRAATS